MSVCVESRRRAVDIVFRGVRGSAGRQRCRVHAQAAEWNGQACKSVPAATLTSVWNGMSQRAVATDGHGLTRRTGSRHLHMREQDPCHKPSRYYYVKVMLK